MKIRLIGKLGVQCSPFITLYLGPLGMDCVISELCYKKTILQKIIGK